MSYRDNLLIKVHRVVNRDEIERLKQFGVNLIGMDVNDDAFYAIDPNPFWNDSRYVTEGHVAELMAVVNPARGFVELDTDAFTPGACGKLAAQGVDLIQTSGWKGVDRQTAAACQSSGVDLISGNQYIEPEDDLRFEKLLQPDVTGLTYYDLQLFPSYKDAWSFLMETSPQHPKDLITLEEINALARQAALFISLNVTPKNVRSIIQTLTPLDIAGLSFTLSPTKLGAFHTFEFEELLLVLDALRRL